MKVIALCGSMRFAQQMQRIALELETKHGYCAIHPIVSLDTPLSDSDLDNIAKAHFKKIDLADIVYIVNIDGYIGESVLKELQYAREHNKEIIFHEKQNI